jgi:hypothetical protein
VGKENYSPFISNSEDLEDGQELERPDFTLPIDEVEEGDEEGIAPTRQVLPGGEDYTFKSIDFASGHPRTPTTVQTERIRRSSRISILPFPDEEDVGDGEEDVTAHSIEYGRRAISEGPVWDKYPRSSFGSIRMSEFGLEESRMEKQPPREESPLLDDANIVVGMDEPIDFEDGYVFLLSRKPQN